MPGVTYFDQFSEDLGKGVHNLDADALKMILTNTAPVKATDALTADITEIAAGNGYVSGGVAVPSSYSQAGGVATFTCTDASITPTGPVAPWRYAVLVNSTAAGGPVIAYYDRGESITSQTGEVISIDFGATTFTLSFA